MHRGLHMWANCIETGDVTLSVGGFHNTGLAKRLKLHAPTRRVLAARLRNLAPDGPPSVVSFLASQFSILSFSTCIVLAF